MPRAGITPGVRFLTYLFCYGLTCASASAGENLVRNGGFEYGLTRWRPFWSRQEGVGGVTVDRQVAHSGMASARIQHRGTNDWSFGPDLRVTVQPGEIFQMEVWLKVQGAGSVTLCASTWDAKDHNVSWTEGDRTVQATKGWVQLRSRFAVPPGVSWIQPRLIGHGPAVIWVDDFSTVKLPDRAVSSRQALPTQLTITNATLEVTLLTSNATFTVLDHRTGRRWTQKPLHADVFVTDARLQGNQVNLGVEDAQAALALRADLQLDPAAPEFTIKISGNGELPSPLRFPHPFKSEPGDRLVVPMNEGISFPVEDRSIEPMRLIAYGGHGICMAFWGVTDDRQGYAAILETPDDAAIHVQSVDGRLAIAPEWDAQKGQFGYARQLRYAFLDHGGHVAIAKRYREYARKNGLLRTLAEKRRENSDVDLLVGAVNVWNWDAEPVELVKEMQAAGIEHILWSRGGSPEALRALNELRVLTSRYDIYQDVMDPAHFPSLAWVDQNWTTAAWAQDIIRRADGDWLRGWAVKGKQGEWYSCGMLCDSRALGYARDRIPAELATHPYRCRFIDTTTASPWNECYSTNHPMTRTESRVWKMKLLESVSRQFKLVTGSETGHEAAVPFVHYFEGMLSLGPYRVPDAGRDMLRIWKEVPQPVAKFQLGQSYRLPLWELVYHDCVVAQWYWGDYNNKLPTLWDKRDLFNVLYGTPPMFMFNRSLWQAQKDRFIQSYRNTCPYVRATGYFEMTDHRFLTPDRNVQQTSFANGTTITVNFGEPAYRLPSGEMLAPMGFHVGN